MGHTDFALDWIRSPHSDVGIYDVTQKDYDRRANVGAASYGEWLPELQAQLLDSNLPSVSHTRDLWRIIRAVEYQHEFMDRKL